MSRFASRLSTRTRIIALALTGLALASVPAAAGKWHNYHGGYGGAVAAGVVGGLVLGGIAASTAPRYYARECWIERQERYTRSGRIYYRDVEVCR